MRSALLVALMGAATACMATQPALEAGAEVDPRALQTPRAIGAHLGEPWIWVHVAPTWFVDTALSGVGMVDHALLAASRVTATVGVDELVVTREGAWQRKIPGAAGAPVVLVMPGVGVYVAMQVPLGSRVVGFTPTGEPMFDTTLGDGAPWQAIQLGLCDPWLCVYGTTDGDRRERSALVKDSGKVIGQSVSMGGPRVKVATWPDDATETKELGTDWVYGSVRYRVIAEGAKVVVERHASEAIVWRVALPEVRASQSQAVVLDHSDSSGRESLRMAVVVLHSPISAGASVFTLRVDGGALVSKIVPPGLGSVDHSQYSNRVAVREEDFGLVFVWGEESAGQYVSLIDPEEGRVETNEAWWR